MTMTIMIMMALYSSRSNNRCISNRCSSKTRCQLEATSEETPATTIVIMTNIKEEAMLVDMVVVAVLEMPVGMTVIPATAVAAAVDMILGIVAWMRHGSP